MSLTEDPPSAAPAGPGRAVPGRLAPPRPNRDSVTTIRPDTVFVPFHWVGANRLTNDALDPSSRMPAFKVCAASLGLDTSSPSGSDHSTTDRFAEVTA